MIPIIILFSIVLLLSGYVAILQYWIHKLEARMLLKFNETKSVLEIIKRDLPEVIGDRIKKYLTEEDAMALIYTLISLRGEFMYNLERRLVSDPKTLQWYFENEKVMLKGKLVKLWPQKPAAEIDEMLKDFYGF